MDLKVWDTEYKLFDSVINSVYLFFVGRSTDGGTDRGVQGGVLTVRQGRRRHHHDQRARHRHALPRTEPHGSRASRHDQRSRRRR